MNLSLTAIASIRVALAMAKLQNPHDPRFVLAYHELLKQWAGDIDDETAALIDASRQPALLKRQV